MAKKKKKSNSIDLTKEKNKRTGRVEAYTWGDAMKDPNWPFKSKKKKRKKVKRG